VILWNGFKRLAAGATVDEKRALFSDTARRIYSLPEWGSRPGSPRLRNVATRPGRGSLCSAAANRGWSLGQDGSSPGAYNRPRAL